MMNFKIKFLFGYHLLLINFQLIQGLYKELPKCHVRINGQLTQKAIGDIWNSSSDLCTKHTCEIDASGLAVEKTFREYCIQTCQNEFQLMPRKNQCCGECVATKCSFNNKLYTIGEMWKSDDNCTFYECSESIKGSPGDSVTSAQINKYKKACPPLGECPSNRVTMKGCCQTCQLEIAKLESKNGKTLFTYPSEQNNITFSSDTYLKHPCRRKCRQDQVALICSYTFIVEWYETLSIACKNCPANPMDCRQPQCIYADGVKRNILVVNRMMPGPALEVCQGDTVVVDVVNNLMGEGTAIHWHGIHQRETPYFDGVPQVTQCAIPSHTTFQYKFKADNSGTHWWHSHVGTQRADGSFGALIVRNAVDDIPKEANLYDYDLSEHVILMHDWGRHIGASNFNSIQHSVKSNKPSNVLINGKGTFFGATNQQAPTNKQSNKILPPVADAQDATPTLAEASASDANSSFLPATEPISQIPIEIPPDFGGMSSPLTDEQTEPLPKNAEIIGRRKRSVPIASSNFTMHEVFNIKPGFKYRFRVINSGFQNCPLEFSVDNHNITVIASDGHYFEPITVESFVSYAGERFDFVLHASQSIANYWIRLRGLLDCDDRYNRVHQGAILRYRGAPESQPIGTPLSYDFRRGGVQLNGLNLAPASEETGIYKHVTITDLKSTEPDNPQLVKDNADYKFFVYFDYFGRKPTNSSQSAVNFNGPQLNYISMKMTPEPLLIARERNDETKFCNSSSLAQHNINCRNEYCECTHIINVPLNATVELVLIDEGYALAAENHPFHLHGYDFRVVGMERLKNTGITVDEIQKLDDAGKIKRHLQNAPIKDTIGVPNGGYVIVRFLANNPGFWLLHCNIESHVETNMALVFKIGDYKQIRLLPKNFPTCNNFKLNVEPIRLGGKSSGSRLTHQVSWIGIVVIATILLY